MPAADLKPGSGEAAQRAAVIVERYQPVSLSVAAAAFTRDLVAQAAPATPARAKALLFAAGRLAGFADRVGLELSAPVLLAEATVERLVAQGCDRLAPASVRTVRTNLRALARCCEPFPEPAPIPLVRERAKAPYSQAQIDAYLHLAACQRSERRQMRCTALICLGAGAGIIYAELRHLRGTDVQARLGGVLVTVGGRRARSVPVLGRYQQPLLAAAGFAGDGLIIGGRDPGRRNISDALARALSGDAGLPRLQAGRLRSTWLVECAQQIGLGAFMQAAGISCSQRLGDLAAQLSRPSDAELVTLLGAAS